MTTDQDQLLPPASDEEAEAGTVDAEEADVKHVYFRATKTQIHRIDQFLVERVSWLSRNIVQRLIGEGLVTVNGKPTKASYKIKNGDVVEMVAPPEPVNDLVPEPIPLDIVYEDEHFLALNKQADLIVHPARGRWSGTLVNGLVHYGSKWSTLNGNWRPGILHRLDKNTTGIMLVAKSDEAHWRLARQFENRTIQKTYLAVCHGVPELLSDVIDLPIGKDKYVRERQAVRKEENGGRPAVTLYETKEVLSHLPAERLLPGSHAHDRKLPLPPPKFSFLKLSPKTGRTHQLRVHMSTIGHPMVGDTMYGGRIIEYAAGAAGGSDGEAAASDGEAGSADGETGAPFRFERQALHAAEITFTHPGTLEQMTLKAPLPPDMLRLLELLRGPGTTRQSGARPQ